MSFEIPKIYPITDCLLTGLTHTEQVRRLIDGGATLIQLREKSGSPREFFKDAGDALKIAHQNNVRIIINDRADIAFALGADGVHLGQEDLPPAKARELLGQNAIIGFSTHNAAQIAEAAKMPIDYVAIGPVFATSTKKNPDPVVGVAGIGEAVTLACGKPVVAIGGIDEGNIGEVMAAGAASAAVISSVLLPRETIRDNFLRLLSNSAAAQHR